MSGKNGDQILLGFPLTQAVSPNKSSYDTLATSLQKITVEEVDTNQSSVIGKADPNSEAIVGSCIIESIGQS